MEKDPAIITMLDQLWLRLGREAFVITDHWESDLCAVGIASPRNSQVLIYISCYGERPERFNFELELPPPPGSDELYLVAGCGWEVSFDELANVVSRHLRSA